MGEVMNFSIGIVAEGGPKLNADWKASVDAYEKTQFELVKTKDDDKSKATLPLSNIAEIEVVAINVGPSDGKTTLKFGGSETGIDVEKTPRIFLIQRNVLPIPKDFSVTFETTSEMPVKIHALIGRNRSLPPK